MTTWSALIKNAPVPPLQVLPPQVPLVQTSLHVAELLSLQVVPFEA
jgi:hypothetical protein